MKGHHYINTLISNFSYIEMALEDTPIFNDVAFAKIKSSFPLSDDYGKRNIYDRVAVVENFLAYLQQEEKTETLESEIFGKGIVSQIIYGANKDILRIKKKFGIEK